MRAAFGVPGCVSTTNFPHPYDDPRRIPVVHLGQFLHGRKYPCNGIVLHLLGLLDHEFQPPVQFGLRAWAQVRRAEYDRQAACVPVRGESADVLLGGLHDGVHFGCLAGTLGERDLQ